MSYWPQDFPIERLSPIEARRLEYFFEHFVLQRFDRYGFGHFILACYAALPAVLTPDLLSKLWLNFKSYQLQGRTFEIHPLAPADLLLSPLLEEIGYEQYEMSEPIRNTLLAYLQKLSQSTDAAQPSVFKLTALSTIAEFLYDYATTDRSPSNTASFAFREAQEWTALSYLNPSAALAKLLDAFEASKDAPNQQMRYHDAINKMASRFELGIVKEVQAIPKDYQGVNCLASLVKAELFNQQLDEKVLERLKPMLSDEPILSPDVLVVKIQGGFDDKLAVPQLPKPIHFKKLRWDLIRNTNLQLSATEQRKYKILEDIRKNEAEYSPYRIGELIKNGDLAEEDLIRTGLITRKALRMLLNPPFFVSGLHGWKDLPPLKSGRTDIYFFGIPSSGKSSLLSGLLSFADKKGFLDLEVTNLLGTKYAHDLIKGVDIGYVPPSTPSEGVNYIDAKLRDDDGSLIPVNIIEMSGEFFKDTYYTGTLNSERSIGANAYLRNNNRKIICLIIDYKQDLSTTQNHLATKQSHQLTTILKLLNDDGTLAKTDGIFIILTKTDLLPNGVGDLQTADQFINDNYLALRNSVRDYALQYRFQTQIYTFSLGRFMLEKTYEYNPAPSEIIFKDLTAVTFRPKKSRNNFFSRLFGR